MAALTRHYAHFYITDVMFAIANAECRARAHDRPFIRPFIEVSAIALTIVQSPRAMSQLEADAPHSLVVRFGADQPLKMDAGVNLSPLSIAYQTYGELNAAKSNAVLICHALTGDQHVANIHPITGKPGWWQTMVGPGRPITRIVSSSSPPMSLAAVWARPV